VAVRRGESALPTTVTAADARGDGGGKGEHGGSKERVWLSLEAW